MDLNKAMIIGRLGSDVELRHTQNNTAVTNLSIATSRQYEDSSGEKQEETVWHKAVLWGRTAEIADEYLSKGDKVYIEGRIQKSKWEDDDGNERTTTEINVRNLIMLGSSGESANYNGSSQGSEESVELDEDFDDIDDELPF